MPDQPSLFGDDEPEDLPVLPYAGPSSGWSGSDTSADRAYYRDSTGLTGKTQRRVIELLEHAGPRGMTWPEVAAAIGQHHGSATGCLSNLHLARRIARLEAKRDRCKIYVLPAYIQGRPTEPQKSDRG